MRRRGLPALAATGERLVSPVSAAHDQHANLAALAGVTNVTACPLLFLDAAQAQELGRASCTRKRRTRDKNAGDERGPLDILTTFHTLIDGVPTKPCDS
jgi:hypothetical protein